MVAAIKLEATGILSRTQLTVEAASTSFIPSFFEIKESAGREFLSKRIGGAFFEA
jgi:hypothetical protein